LTAFIRGVLSRLGKAQFSRGTENRFGSGLVTGHLTAVRIMKPPLSSGRNFVPDVAKGAEGCDPQQVISIWVVEDVKGRVAILTSRSESFLAEPHPSSTRPRIFSAVHTTQNVPERTAHK
jgi:hypothetical protein